MAVIIPGKAWRLSAVIISIVLLTVSVFGQPKPRLLDKETFMEMESVGNPSISPDGKQIVCRWEDALHFRDS